MLFSSVCLVQTLVYWTQWSSCAQARRGVLRAELRAPLLPLLLGPSSGGALAFLVRHALDDEHAGTHCAAIDLLHAVLVCERDEVRASAFPRARPCARPLL